MLEDFAELSDPPERRRRWQEMMRFLEMAIKVEERQRRSRVSVQVEARAETARPRRTGSSSG